MSDKNHTSSSETNDEALSMGVTGVGTTGNTGTTAVNSHVEGDTATSSKTAADVPNVTNVLKGSTSDKGLVAGNQQATLTTDSNHANSVETSGEGVSAGLNRVVSPSTPTINNHVEDDVTTGSDGFEHHKSASGATSHELHGSDTLTSVLEGGSADDVLIAGNQTAILDGGTGSNTLQGGISNDIMVAGGTTNQGHNHLDGGQGDDILVAAGMQTNELHQFLGTVPSLVSSIISNPNLASLANIVQGDVSSSGGSGATNTFGFQTANGHDAIYNFHTQTDVLEIHRGLNGSDIQDVESLLHHMRVSGNNVAIDLGNGNSVDLVGVDVAHLSAANVVFI